MNTALRPFRRSLILLLALALAVSAWPALDVGEWEDVAFGGSRPWQAQQSGDATAVIETLAEIDANEGTARGSLALGLAGDHAIDSWAASLQFIRAAASVATPTSLTLFPNKTGPPSA